jgi:GNAT superfamily N-acetyltransferase
VLLPDCLNVPGPIMASRRFRPAFKRPAWVNGPTWGAGHCSRNDVCMIIRARTDEDLKQCAELAQRVRNLDGYPPYLLGGVNEFIQSSDAISVWVAEIVGEIVGHASLHSSSSDVVMELAHAVTQRPLERFGVVSRLFVSPLVRRAGIGQRLLRTAETHAVGQGLWPMLDVATQFQAAIKLYELRGWTRAGRVTVPLPDGSSLDEFVYLAPSPAPSV